MRSRPLLVVPLLAPGIAVLVDELQASSAESRRRLAQLKTASQVLLFEGGRRAGFLGAHDNRLQRREAGRSSADDRADVVEGRAHVDATAAVGTQGASTACTVSVVDAVLKLDQLEGGEGVGAGQQVVEDLDVADEPADAGQGNDELTCVLGVGKVLRVDRERVELLEAIEGSDDRLTLCVLQRHSRRNAGNRQGVQVDRDLALDVDHVKHLARQQVDAEPLKVAKSIQVMSDRLRQRTSSGIFMARGRESSETGRFRKKLRGKWG